MNKKTLNSIAKCADRAGCKPKLISGINKLPTSALDRLAKIADDYAKARRTEKDALKKMARKLKTYVLLA